MKKFLLLILAVLSTSAAMAYDFSVLAPSGHTLHYSTIGNGSNVTLVGCEDDPSGEFIIPESVTHMGSGCSRVSSKK